MNDTIGAALSSFAATPGGQALAVLYVLAVLDLIVSSAVAFQKGVFVFGLVDAWIRTNLSKLVIVTAGLVGGHILGGLTIDGVGLIGPALTTASVAGAAVYAVAVLASLGVALKGEAKTPTE